MPLSPYVQERINNLNSIDLKLVSTLDNASKIVESLIELKDPAIVLSPEETDTKKHVFQKNVVEFHQNLHTSVTQLIEEIKLYKVPVNISVKKNIGQDDEKLDAAWKALKDVMEN
ncbi:hypothetical protein ACO0QE_002110 [Hanseniaspora vineae]